MRREGRACVGACAPNCTKSEGDEMGSALAALCIDEAAAVAVHLVLTPWTKVICAGSKHVPWKKNCDANELLALGVRAVSAAWRVLALPLEFVGLPLPVIPARCVSTSNHFVSSAKT